MILSYHDTRKVKTIADTLRKERAPLFWIGTLETRDRTRIMRNGHLHPGYVHLLVQACPSLFRSPVTRHQKQGQRLSQVVADIRTFVHGNSITTSQKMSRIPY